MYQPLVIFFRGCVPEVVVTSYVVGYICVLVLFLLLCRFMVFANNRMHYGPMVVFIYLQFTLPHCYHYADVSEGIGILKYKLVRYILPSVCLRFSQFSQLSVIKYMGPCVISLPIPLMMIIIICILYFDIIIKWEVWLNCHCLGLAHETMTCGVCLSIILYSYTEISIYFDN